MFVAIFKDCWLTTGSWKNAYRGLEIPGKVQELFVTNRVGTLKLEPRDFCDDVPGTQSPVP